MNPKNSANPPLLSLVPKLPNNFMKAMNPDEKCWDMS